MCDLNRSKYGNKISGQNSLFDKAEKRAQGIAADQAKKKVGESFDKSINDVKSQSESKPPPLPARNNSRSNTVKQIGLVLVNNT